MHPQQLRQSRTPSAHAANAGQRIAFSGDAGVLVESGAGDSILSNSIFQQQAAWGSTWSRRQTRKRRDNQCTRARWSQQPPELPGLDDSHIPTARSLTSGTFNSLPDETFLIQFFTNPTADPSGYGQGQTVPRFDPVHHGRQRQRRHQRDLGLGLTTGYRTAIGDSHEPDDRRHLRVLGRISAHPPHFSSSQAIYVTTESSGTAPSR